jgi:hypothetical protein
VAFRFDTQRLDAKTFKRTGAGAMRVPALLTRSDVFDYHEGGKLIREYRPLEEVQKADSIASLKDLPVTNRHPKSFVDPTNVRSLSIGHVSSESPRADGTGVAADLVIAPGDAQRSVGVDLVEVSCGYRVDLDETPGVTPDGKPYDRVQRNIVYNHVALGPRNWGRQGNTVSMRLDSAGDEIPPADLAITERTMKTIRIDGRDFTYETDAELQLKLDAHYAEKAAKDSKAKIDAAEATAAAEKVRADKAVADAAAEKVRADAAPALVKARVALEAQATELLGKAFKADGKKDAEIKVEMIKHFDSSFAEAGKSEVAIDATLDVWLKAAPARATVDSSTARMALALGGAGGDGRSKTDDNGVEKIDAYDSDAAKARRNDRLNKGWEKPSPHAITYDEARRPQA